MKKVIACVCIYILTCPGFMYAQNNTTAGWRPNATLTLYQGPGMQPEWSKIIISDTACWYITGGGAAEKKYHFILAKKELDALFRFIKDNKLQEMLRHACAAGWTDMGTTSISFNSDKQHFFALESASLDLKHKWHNRFQAIAAYVYTLLGKAEK